jgi:hypothetical protein
VKEDHEVNFYGNKYFTNQKDNKGQAMFLRYHEEKDMKKISAEEFRDNLMKYVQPERLTPEDTRDSVYDSPTLAEM